MLHRTIAIAALIAALSVHAHADETTFFAVITRAPKLTDERPGMYVDDGDCERYVGLTDAKLAWHMDANVKIPLCDLKPGTRVKVDGSYYTANSVEVISLGPHAMGFVVEDWIVEATRNRPELVLSQGEILTMEAMGSGSWFVRDSVTRALRDKGMAALKQLAWMRHHRDPEVRLRAEMLLVRLGWEK